MVEHGSDHEWFYHKHHIGFGSLIYSINEVLCSFEIIIPPLKLMRLVSALSATGTLILFYLFCYKRYSKAYKLSIGNDMFWNDVWFL